MQAAAFLEDTIPSWHAKLAKSDLACWQSRCERVGILLVGGQDDFCLWWMVLISDDGKTKVSDCSSLFVNQRTEKRIFLRASSIVLNGTKTDMTLCDI